MNNKNGKLYLYMQVSRANFLITSLLPVLVALAAAVYSLKEINWFLFMVTAVGVMSLHSLTNMTNEYYDYKKGIDSNKEKGTIHLLASGKISPKEVRSLCAAAFALALVCLLIVFYFRGAIVLIIGLAGLMGGYFYTAPPLEYKYKAWGEIMIFFLMGPALVSGAFLAITGTTDASAVAASIPAGFLITAVLISNNIRDIKKDSAAGVKTLPMRIGADRARLIYAFLLYASLLSIVIAVFLGMLPVYSLTVLIIFLLIRQAIKKIRSDNESALHLIDLETLKIYVSVNLILIFSLIAGRMFL